MTRVTYGVASSAYHSIRALQECAKAHAPNDTTLQVILKDFYVDDCLTGADTQSEAEQLQDDLILTLDKRHLPLRKFSSNLPELVERLPEDLQEASQAYSIKDESLIIKTLGVSWLPLPDVFGYFANTSDLKAPITKRTLLSDMSKLFDPIGLLAPILITAKII